MIGVYLAPEILSSSMVNSWPGKNPELANAQLLHSCLQAGEINQIMDPIAELTYKDIWMTTAKTNTAIYQDVFSCVPNDLIHTRLAFRQSTTIWKERIGHTVYISHTVYHLS
ncbi:hypothetical protein K1719_039601 [Acacia pycnantha]|nr:hypothetical protein K1719_039601 [Acacia pycnantha]